MAALVAAAMTAKRRSIAIATRLAHEIGQHEGDILALLWSACDGRAIRIRQGKTDRWVGVPVTEELRQLLDAQPRISTHVVVSEQTGRPYTPFNFVHVFKRVRDKVRRVGRFALPGSAPDLRREPGPRRLHPAGDRRHHRPRDRPSRVDPGDLPAPRRDHGGARDRQTGGLESRQTEEGERLRNVSLTNESDTESDRSGRTLG